VEELELVPVRLHDPTGGDVGRVELPVGWVIELGDVLLDEHGRLVRVVDFVLASPGAAIAALVKVTPPPERVGRLAAFTRGSQ
jgi:hypothetical protein